MKRFSLIALLAMFILGNYFPLKGQIDVEVTIQSGSASTTCTDFISAADPLWQVNIENEGWVVYPETGNCFTPLPNVQYTASYNCADDVPVTLQVCFAAFENDDLGYEIGTGCGVNTSCLETICQDVAIPAPGFSADNTVGLPVGLSSDGEVNITISTIGTAGANNLPCNAIDLGVIPTNGTVGDGTLGLYSNQCADNLNEPNPSNDGSWFNDSGVWFSFATDDTPGGVIRIDAINDPEGVGDDINLQIALYESDNNACDGNLDFVIGFVNNGSNDVELEALCLEPNRTYYLLVDGDAGVLEEAMGVFGLEVNSIGVTEGGDTRCEAEDLGLVPDGGFVTTAGPRSNYCAQGVGDPFIQAFQSQSSVWFTFIAPTSGHVIIEAVSESDIDPVGLQLAFYRPFSGTCTGFFSHLTSVYTSADLDESIEVTCLYDGEPYYVLVDGDANDNRGVFTLTVTDAGDITPTGTVDVTICAGDSYSVAGSVYTETGTYFDTLQLFAGCDSIVNTNLTVLEPITVEVEQTMPSIGEGTPNGVATVTASGGAGNYSYLWCTGETTPQASNLVGGEECCVTVTDEEGCEAEFCFEVEFILDVIPSFTNDTLDCFGDTTGTVTISAINGLPPYNYSWQNEDNSINGTGILNAEGEEAIIPDLPAGLYTFNIADEFSDTTFIATVMEPEPISVMLLDQADASCFGFCDGSIEVSASGGTGAFTYTWTNGIPDGANPVGVCAGEYQLTVLDENLCEESLEVSVAEPEEFMATLTIEQPISCFEGSDGAISVSTNGNPILYNWNNGDDSATITDLESGIYEVTVTNEDNCEDIEFINLEQPSDPVSASVEVLESISCFGGDNGSLAAVPAGPGVNFSYNWSTGDQEAVVTDLPAGDYSVTITNEFGCDAMTQFQLGQPSEIIAQISTEDINCLNSPSGGVINIDTIYGGVPDYEFSLEGIIYGSTPTFPGLFEGQYEVIVSDAEGCERIFPATIVGPPELVVDLGGDFNLQQGDSTTLEAIANSQNVSYIWKTSDSLGINNENTLVVAPIQSTAYQVEVIDSVTFCRATDFIFVTVVKDRNVFIPNAFSPNDDGPNDKFIIFGGVGIREVKSFRIFSRSGNLLFEQEGFQPNDPDYGWNGEFRGQPVNTGVYVYMAEIEFVDGEVEVFKGDLTLLR